MERDRKETLKLAVLLIVLATWMVFIFGMSANNGDESQGLSDRVAAFLAGMFVPGFDGLSAIDQEAILATMSFPIRKAAHFTEYAILGLLAFSSLMQACKVRAASCGEQGGVHEAHEARNARCDTKDVVHGVRGALRGISSAKQACAAVLFSFAYASLDEFHQLFVAGRCGKPFDVMIDTLGALTAVAIAAAVVRARSRKASSWSSPN